jgi:GNAT superfamily N-acetyltransferase
MSHIIREYTQQDVDAIKKCIVELQNFEQMMDPHRLDGMEVAHDYLQYLLDTCKGEEGKIFVVEINEAIEGMIAIVIEHHPKHMRKVQRHAVITDLIIMPEHRGKGISKELIAKAEEYAKSKNVNVIQTHILAKHTEGMTNFLRNGFSEFEIVLRKRV